MTQTQHGSKPPQVMFDGPTLRRELLFSSVVCSLAAIVMVLLVGAGEWQGFLLAANLNAGLAVTGIACTVRRLRPTLQQARHLFLLLPLAVAMLGSLPSFMLPMLTELSVGSKLWLIGIGMLMNLMLGATLYSRAHGRTVTAAWQAEQLRNAEQRQQLLSAELKMLQAQIEPHFLFNTLANLRTLISLDPSTALILFDHINEYLRATLARARDTSGCVADEFALLQHYLAIMQLRMGERLAFHIDCPGEVARLPLPPLLVQPLVENAIRHGIEPSINGGTVTLSANLVGDRLQVLVADSGIGTQQSGAASSVGLNNIRQRLQALYGDAATLQLTNNQPRGTIAVLTLPLPQ